MKKTFAIVLLAALPFGAQAQTENVPQKIGPFGQAGTYELTNVFSLQSVFGTSTSRDVTSASGSGSVGLDTGYIEVATGTSSGSTAQLDTVQRGQYQPGKAARAGIGLNVVTAPTSDGVAEWGLGDGDNGAFWRLKGDGSKCVVYERASSEAEFCDGNLNGQRADKWLPADEGYVYAVRFNWYGVGGAQFIAYKPDDRLKGTLRPIVLHTYSPPEGQAMEDPNQPIFVSADNGSTTTDVELEVGGRTYDVQGRFRPPFRTTFERRTGVSVGTSYTPLICVRREDPFPEAGRQNSVNVFVQSVTPTVSSEDIVLSFAHVSDLADLTGESFADPSDFADGDTAVEYDKSATDISNVKLIGGGFTFEAGAQQGGGQAAIVSKEKGKRIPLIQNDPTCAIAKTDANSATVDLTLRVREEW